MDNNFNENREENIEGTGTEPKEEPRTEFVQSKVETTTDTVKLEKSGKTGKIIFFALIAIILLIAGIATVAILAREDDPKDAGNKSSPKADAALEISDSKTYEPKTEQGSLTAVQIAEKVKPSVVAVITYKGIEKFGEGSAVVMGPDKSSEYTYFVTCAHIVDNAGVTAKIELQDQTQYDADIVGYDSRTDVAVLRVKGNNFTPAEFGDSTVLKVGEPVYAIGNPGGTAFYGSFTGGYVSAIDRPTAANSNGYTMECIQHDAAINPGNSGGALINSFGQVIGINSSKIASAQYEGMGFAIPISVAKDVVDDIISNGYVTNRGKLGITYLAAKQNSTYAMVLKANKLPDGSIIIATIDADGALANTKVKEGDLIISVNGKDLKDSKLLLQVIEKAKAGEELVLGIASVNDDYSVKTFEVKVKLVEDRGSAKNTTPSKKDSGGFTNPFAE